MKKILIFMMLILLFVMPVIVVLGQDDIDPEVIETVKMVKDTAVGIFDLGFVKWIKSNWWVFILLFVTVGKIITTRTATKKDDKFFKKYIMTPVRWVAKIFSLPLKE